MNSFITDNIYDKFQFATNCRSISYVTVVSVLYIGAYISTMVIVSILYLVICTINYWVQRTDGYMIK